MSKSQKSKKTTSTNYKEEEKKEIDKIVKMFLAGEAKINTPELSDFSDNTSESTNILFLSSVENVDTVLRDEENTGVDTNCIAELHPERIAFENQLEVHPLSVAPNEMQTKINIGNKTEILPRLPPTDIPIQIVPPTEIHPNKILNHQNEDEITQEIPGRSSLADITIFGRNANERNKNQQRINDQNYERHLERCMEQYYINTYHEHMRVKQTTTNIMIDQVSVIHQANELAKLNNLLNPGLLHNSDPWNILYEFGNPRNRIRNIVAIFNQITRPYPAITNQINDDTSRERNQSIGTRSTDSFKSETSNVSNLKNYIITHNRSNGRNISQLPTENVQTQGSTYPRNLNSLDIHKITQNGTDFDRKLPFNQILVQSNSIPEHLIKSENKSPNLQNNSVALNRSSNENNSKNLNAVTTHRYLNGRLISSQTEPSQHIDRPVITYKYLNGRLVASIQYPSRSTDNSGILIKYEEVKPEHLENMLFKNSKKSFQNTSESNPNTSESIQNTSSLNNNSEGIRNTSGGIQHTSEDIQNSFSGLKNTPESIPNTSSGIQNIFEGIQNTSEGNQNSSGGIQNTCEGIQNPLESIQNFLENFYNISEDVHSVPTQNQTVTNPLQNNVDTPKNLMPQSLHPEMHNNTDPRLNHPESNQNFVLDQKYLITPQQFDLGNSTNISRFVPNYLHDPSNSPHSSETSNSSNPKYLTDLIPSHLLSPDSQQNYLNTLVPHPEHYSSNPTQNYLYTIIPPDQPHPPKTSNYLNHPIPQNSSNFNDPSYFIKKHWQPNPHPNRSFSNPNEIHFPQNYRENSLEYERPRRGRPTTNPYGKANETRKNKNKINHSARRTGEDNVSNIRGIPRNMENIYYNPNLVIRRPGEGNYNSRGVLGSSIPNQRRFDRNLNTNKILSNTIPTNLQKMDELNTNNSIFGNPMSTTNTLRNLTNPIAGQFFDNSKLMEDLVTTRRQDVLGTSRRMEEMGHSQNLNNFHHDSTNSNVKLEDIGIEDIRGPQNQEFYQLPQINNTINQNGSVINNFPNSGINIFQNSAVNNCPNVTNSHPNSFLGSATGIYGNSTNMHGNSNNSIPNSDINNFLGNATNMSGNATNIHGNGPSNALNNAINHFQINYLGNCANNQVNNIRSNAINNFTGNQNSTANNLISSTNNLGNTTNYHPNNTTNYLINTSDPNSSTNNFLVNSTNNVGSATNNFLENSTNNPNSNVTNFSNNFRSNYYPSNVQYVRADLLKDYYPSRRGRRRKLHNFQQLQNGGNSTEFRQLNDVPIVIQDDIGILDTINNEHSCKKPKKEPDELDKLTNEVLSTLGSMYQDSTNEGVNNHGNNNAVISNQVICIPEINNQLISNEVIDDQILNTESNLNNEEVYQDIGNDNLNYHDIKVNYQENENVGNSTQASEGMYQTENNLNDSTTPNPDKEPGLNDWLSSNDISSVFQPNVTSVTISSECKNKNIQRNGSTKSSDVSKVQQLFCHYSEENLSVGNVSVDRSSTNNTLAKNSEFFILTLDDNTSVGKSSVDKTFGVSSVDNINNLSGNTDNSLINSNNSLTHSGNSLVNFDNLLANSDNSLNNSDNSLATSDSLTDSENSSVNSANFLTNFKNSLSSSLNSLTSSMNSLANSTNFLANSKNSLTSSTNSLNNSSTDSANSSEKSSGSPSNPYHNLSSDDNTTINSTTERSDLHSASADLFDGNLSIYNLSNSNLDLNNLSKNNIPLNLSNTLSSNLCNNNVVINDLSKGNLSLNKLPFGSHCSDEEVKIFKEEIKSSKYFIINDQESEDELPRDELIKNNLMIAPSYNQNIIIEPLEFLIDESDSNQTVKNEKEIIQSRELLNHIEINISDEILNPLENSNISVDHQSFFEKKNIDSNSNDGFLDSDENSKNMSVPYDMSQNTSDSLVSKFHLVEIETENCFNINPKNLKFIKIENIIHTYPTVMDIECLLSKKPKVLNYFEIINPEETLPETIFDFPEQQHLPKYPSDKETIKSELFSEDCNDEIDKKKSILPSQNTNLETFPNPNKSDERNSILFLEKLKYLQSEYPHLEWSQMEGYQLEWCHMEGSQIERYTFEETQLEESRQEDSRMEVAQLEGPQQSELEGPQESELEGPQDTQLERPQESQLEGPQESQLEQFSMEVVQVEGPQLEVCQSEIEGCQLEEFQSREIGPHLQLEKPISREFQLEESHLEDFYLDGSQLENPESKESRSNLPESSKGQLEDSHFKSSQLEVSELEGSQSEKSQWKESLSEVLPAKYVLLTDLKSQRPKLGDPQLGYQSDEDLQETENNTSKIFDENYQSNNVEYFYYIVTREINENRTIIESIGTKIIQFNPKYVKLKILPGNLQETPELEVPEMIQPTIISNDSYSINSGLEEIKTESFVEDNVPESIQLCPVESSLEVINLKCVKNEKSNLENKDVKDKIDTNKHNDENDIHDENGKNGKQNDTSYKYNDKSDKYKTDKNVNDKANTEDTIRPLGDLSISEIWPIGFPFINIDNNNSTEILESSSTEVMSNIDDSPSNNDESAYNNSDHTFLNHKGKTTSPKLSPTFSSENFESHHEYLDDFPINKTPVNELIVYTTSPNENKESVQFLEINTDPIEIANPKTEVCSEIKPIQTRKRCRRSTKKKRKRIRFSSRSRTRRLSNVRKSARLQSKNLEEYRNYQEDDSDVFNNPTFEVLEVIENSKYHQIIQQLEIEQKEYTQKKSQPKNYTHKIFENNKPSNSMPCQISPNFTHYISDSPNITQFSQISNFSNIASSPNNQLPKYVTILQKIRSSPNLSPVKVLLSESERLLNEIQRIRNKYKRESSLLDYIPKLILILVNTLKNKHIPTVGMILPTNTILEIKLVGSKRKIQIPYNFFLESILSVRNLSKRSQIKKFARILEILKLLCSIYNDTKRLKRKRKGNDKWYEKCKRQKISGDGLKIIFKRMDNGMYQIKRSEIVNLT